MYKRFIAILFLFFYLAFLFVPALPFIHYYLFSSHSTFQQNGNMKRFNNNEDTHTGDTAYLLALMKSAKKHQAGKKNENPPPSSNSEINNLIYLNNVDAVFFVETDASQIHFIQINKTLLWRYLTVTSPPPNKKVI